PSRASWRSTRAPRRRCSPCPTPSPPQPRGPSFYALEGDWTLPATASTTPPCNSAEYLEVDGDSDPTQNGVCKFDHDHPPQNIFNGTINVQPQGDKPACPAGTPAWECCNVDGECAVVGVDIDRFDISDALTPGVTDLRVSMGTTGDRVYLATLVVGVD